MKKEIEELTEKIIAFRDARNWRQFHNPKDLALSLVLEAAEVLEHFQWKSRDDVAEYLKTSKDEVGKELADVMYWVLLMSHDLEIDIRSSLIKKLEENDKKYPIEKSLNSSKKYTEL